MGAAEGAPLSSRTSESRSSYRVFPPFWRGALAFLQYRKTPLRDGGKSPAQLLLGRRLRIGIAAPSDEPSTGQITWRRGRERWHEAKLSEMQAKLAEYWSEGPDPRCCDEKVGWNQGGDESSAPIRQYTVRLDEYGRLVIRNRKFLQPMQPVLPPVP